MSSALVRRRAAKAARRKAIVKLKRKLEGTGRTLPLAERARHLAAAPIRCCLLQEGLFERGNGTLLLARDLPTGEVAFALFLIDVYCLGVKDVVFERTEEVVLEEYIESMGLLAPLVPVDPSYARRLLREAVAYAQSLGFAPHADYAAVEALFGKFAADAATTFAFGFQGKPCYLPGPGETAGQISRRLADLDRRFGKGGFHFTVPLEGSDVLTDLDLDASEHTLVALSNDEGDDRDSSPL